MFCFMFFLNIFQIVKMGPINFKKGGGGKKRKRGVKDGEEKAPRPPKIKKDKEFYRGRKFIKNKYAIKKVNVTNYHLHCNLK